MSIESLAIYTGYAFCHAVNVQLVLEEDALMVPYVIYWEQLEPRAVPYPADTQSEAVENSIEARRNKEKNYSGWSSGREGLVTLRNGEKHDVLFIEAKIPEISEPLVILYLYKTKPFNLVENFNFQSHPEVRKTEEESKKFMKYFVKGVEMHPKKEGCFERVKNSLKL